jgi:ABC-type bacteriocin/lantibiotic exporter with double-glycine peptidase domain
MGTGSPLPSSCHLERVPLAAHTSDWCGPAALAAVLVYWDDTVEVEQIAQAIHLPDYRGSLNLDLLIVARRRGFDAWAGESTTDELRRALARGRPVICMVRRRNPLAARNHFVVLRGYDTGKRLWFLDSGEGAEERIAHDDFDREWRDAGRWMLVVEGPRAGPSTGETPAQPEHSGRQHQ